MFENTDGNKSDILKGVITCNIDFTVYKFHCSSSSKQYVGSHVTSFAIVLITVRVHFVNYLSRVNPQKLIKNTFICTLNYLNIMLWMTGE